MTRMVFYGEPTTSDRIWYQRNLVVELPVYSDESLGWDGVEDPQGDCCPCEIDLSRLHTGLCSCSEWPVLPWLRTMGCSSPQRVSSFSISIRRNRSTRNLLSLRRIWS